MQNSLTKIKKTLLLISLFVVHFTQAQNISVSVLNDQLIYIMSGATNISDLHSELNSGNDTLIITSDIGAGTLSLSGSPSGVSVNNTNKTIIVDLTTFSTFEGIEIIGSSGDDSITIGTGGMDLSLVNASSDQYLTIDLGTGSDNVIVDNPLKVKGAGEISINVSKSIVINASVTSENGGIYLTSNLQPSPTSGNFIGIEITGDIKTDSANGGEIYIESKGGNSGQDNYGVYIHGGKIVKAGGTSNVNIIGTGGNSTGGGNYGVYISENGSEISAVAGQISISGYGGGTGSSSAFNIGVISDSTGGIISHDGTDSFSSISIIGYAGNGSNQNQTGVLLQNEVRSSGGDISIEGIGGSNAGSFTSNIGISMKGAAAIHAGGNGDIIIFGTATASQALSDGLQMNDTAKILTDNGLINITGSSSSNNFGIICNGTNIISTGNNQTLTLTANKADLSNISAGAGTIALMASSGIDIDLGGADGNSTLGFSSGELNQMSAGQLIIGDTTQTGNISIRSSINPALILDSIQLNTGTDILFSSGIFQLGGRHLRMACVNLNRDSGSLDVSDTNAILTFYNSQPINLPQGLFTAAINQLEINGSGSLTLKDSTTISGKLAINNGTLDLGNNSLALNGIISAMSPDHGLTGSSSSKLSIGGDGANSMGRLYFSSGSELLHTLILDRTGATGSNPVIFLGSDVSIGNSLMLKNGKMALDSHTITFTGTTITGGDSGSYIQIKGSAGFKRAGGSSVLFPVGYNPYLPVILDCVSCSGTDFTVLVSPGVSDQSNTPITSDVVNATWTIQSSTNQSADITFQWPGTAELSMPHTGITLGTRTSNVSSWSRLATNLTVSGSDPYSISYSGFNFNSGINNFFGIGGSATPLPVHFLNLEVTCGQISWQTNDALPMSNFEILASHTGNDWTVIGHINGSSDQSSFNTYLYRLTAENNLYHYYRIRMTGIDHAGVLSDIAVSKCIDNKNQVSFYPNPVKDELMLNGLEEGTSIQLYNAMGVLVYNNSCDTEKTVIDMSEMPVGIYLLYINQQHYTIMKS